MMKEVGISVSNLRYDKCIPGADESSGETVADLPLVSRPSKTSLVESMTTDDPLVLQVTGMRRQP